MEPWDRGGAENSCLYKYKRQIIYLISRLLLFNYQRRVVLPGVLQPLSVKYHNFES